MFFIGGIANGVKQLYYGRKMFCRYCGELSQVSLVMTYTYFSFFFIPIFKWNKRFYLEYRCCRRQYEVPYETGMAVMRGEDIEINPSELVLVGRGEQTDTGDINESSNKSKCPSCGRIVNPDFEFCPYCGNKL